MFAPLETRLPLRSAAVPSIRRALTQHARRHDPLRILFCGSDAFSIASLKALAELKKAQSGIIHEIDVLHRPAKATGRGLKVLREAPIAQAAKDLRLKSLTLDKRTDWDELPQLGHDLIITASFGLLVPGKIISGARYGGLNVHPSLLPQFRGAAPIQYALMNRVKKTGVSVQTMHPTKFDHGLVLAQTPYQMPAQQPTYDQLMSTLGDVGGSLLARAIDQGLFVDPKQIDTAYSGAADLSKAPKITPADRQIQWSSWGAEDIIARDNALSDLWDGSEVMMLAGMKGVSRVTFTGPWKIVQASSSSDLQPGSVQLVQIDGKDTVGFQTVDGKLVAPQSATIASQAKGAGLNRLAAALREKQRRTAAPVL